ncbi:MAG: hypothetical protein ABL860_07830 [Candidatus Nitrotoga sp.]
MSDGLLKSFKTIGLILTLGVSMSACSGDQRWQEEVQLSDGRVIVVERELLTESGGDEWALNRSGSKPKEYRIRFEYPEKSGKMIEWKSKKIDAHFWPEIPLILDMVNTKPIVFSDVFNSVGCHVYSKYIYQDGAWIEEPLLPQFEKRATNLLIFESRNRQRFFDLEAKRKNNSDVTLRTLMQVGPKHPYCR